jgi:tetratricopeptide (TPR) repeat protein
MSKSRPKLMSIPVRAPAPGPETPLARVLKHPALISLALVLATFGVYWPLLKCDFVGYDDTVYVTQNWHVLRGLSWDQVDWAFSSTSEGFWHPLTWLSHMLDVQLYGVQAWGHHLSSLLLHMANTVLLFLGLRRLTGAVWRSALVAALFALHPLHVEAVAFVAERKEVLSAFFGLLMLWTYAVYVEKSKGQSPQAKNYYVLTLALFACALMSKPMVVTLPLVLLLLDYWPLGRLAGSRGQGAGSPSQAPGRRTQTLGQLFLEKVPFLGLSLVVGLITIYTEMKLGAVSVRSHIPLLMRLGNAVVSLLHYLEQTVWPVRLAVYYPFPRSIRLDELALAAGVLVVISGLVWWARRRKPYLAVGWLWFLVMLSLVSGVAFQVGAFARADRFTYLPLIGVFIMVVWALAGWFARSPKGRAVGGILSVAVLAALGVQTNRQLPYWHDPGTIFEHALAVTKDNFTAYNNLGYYLLTDKRQPDEAIADFKEALRIDAKNAGAWNNLGFAYANKDQVNDAYACYQKALQYAPDDPDAHSNLGNILSDAGRLDEAVYHYRLALKARPDFADAHNNLGIALAGQGKLDEAMDQFRMAIYIQPANAGAHNSLGNIFTLRQQYADALPEYQTALQLNPNYAEAHNNLGFALAGLGRDGEAMDQYHQALRLNPNYPPAHYNLGCALLRQNQRDEAVAQFKETLRLDPDHAGAKKQLQDLAAAKPSP